ncbi:MAG TPA: TonB family protein [Nevskiales bacterium]|nr:TonB family protein [Nevskiales bacterium]
MALDRAQLAALSLSLLLHAAALAAIYRGPASRAPDRPAADAVLLVRLITPAPGPAAAVTPVAPAQPSRPQPAPPPASARSEPARPQAVATLPEPQTQTPHEVIPDPVPPAEAPSADEAPLAAAATPAAEATGELLIQEPRFRRPPQPPAYPRQSRLRGESGTVLVRARVEADGSLSEVQLLVSSGYRLLDRAALAAVRQWEIEPWRQGERRLAAWVELPVVFRLEDPPTLARH